MHSTSRCQNPVGTDANECQLVVGQESAYTKQPYVEKECRISADLGFACTRTSISDIVRDGSLCGLRPVSEIRVTENARTNWGYIIHMNSGVSVHQTST